MEPDGSSRCFVHLSAAVAATSNASHRRFEVTLPGAVVLVRNHLHVLETQFFNTPMVRAKLERRGRGTLVFVIELRADVTPTMHVDPDPAGGVNVVVDLPAGRYVEGPPQIGGEVRLSDSERDGSAGSSGLGRYEENDRAGSSGSVRPSETREAPTMGGSTSAPRSEPPTGQDDERPPVFGGSR